MLVDSDWRLQLIIIAQVILSMILGGLIGFERELANKPAGFRTHTLVAGAACLFMAVAGAVQHYLALGSTVTIDPLRVAAAIVTGVSFLGAGTIFRSSNEHSKVGGLTTAATIWTAAAVGLSVALGQLIAAVGMTMLALIVLRGMKVLERNRQMNS
jgi:putative Mg2+ transporter-C (MgtC) family protein